MRIAATLASQDVAYDGVQAHQMQKEQRARRDNGNPTNSLVFTRFMALAILYGQMLQDLKEKYPHGAVDVRRYAACSYLRCSDFMRELRVPRPVVDTPMYNMLSY